MVSISVGRQAAGAEPERRAGRRAQVFRCEELAQPDLAFLLLTSLSTYNSLGQLSPRTASLPSTLARFSPSSLSVAMAEFSRLVVPKPPRTSTENVQKKESTYWKSYKVCESSPSTRLQPPAHRARFTSVAHLSQILRAPVARSLLPFIPTPLCSHFGYSTTDLLAKDEPRRQDHLPFQGRRDQWRDSHRRQAMHCR